jgi:hypothetical protein
VLRSRLVSKGETEMDKEEKELDAIYSKYNVLEIGGVKIPLNYPMRAWRIIKTEFGGFDGIQKTLSEDPLSFVMDKMPRLVQIGLIENELDIKDIENYLDGYTIYDMTNNILPVLMNALTGALPVQNESAVPMKAKTVK